MINENSIKAVSSSHLGDGFVAPLSDSYSYGRIPKTILGLFDGALGEGSLPVDTLPADFKPSKRVVALMMDALGWCFIKEHLGTHPFVKRFEQKGVVSRLTSQFPSTTAVHVTTMHTGLPVAEHGIPEFRFFEPHPKVMDIINPFKFGLQRDEEREGLKGAVEPSDIYPSGSLYEQLKKRGVKSHLFIPPKDNGTVYNDALVGGSPAIYPFTDISEGVKALADVLSNKEENGYFYLYYGGIDKIAHKKGPSSPEAKAEVKKVLDALEDLYLSGQLSNPGTATLMFADHGQIDVDTRNSIYLDVIYPELSDHLIKGTDGKPLAPGGSPRDVFVYTKPESTDVVACELSSRLGDAGVVKKTSDLIAQGVFGANVSSKLIGRLPSLIVLPTGNNTIWTKADAEEGKYKLGHHGGLSPEEMEIPYLAMQS